MVKIRLTRTGKKHEPHYRIVATDSRVARDAKYIEKIGYYNPRTKPPTLEYDKDILQKWIDQGAQMTDTVHDIFVREGVIKQTGKRKAQIKTFIETSKKRAEASSKESPDEPKPEKKEEKNEIEQEKSTDEKQAKKPKAGKEDKAEKKEKSSKEANTKDKPSDDTGKTDQKEKTDSK